MSESGSTASSKANGQFPRSGALPKQSPLFWVSEKDRYLRQLLIRDIQEQTGRRFVVYFALPDAAGQINHGDDAYLVELLQDCKGEPVDLMLETPGGFTDAAEKLASVLRQMAPDLRVIVPCRAKSNGTMLALTGSAIVMGVGSELGPADPFINLGPNNSIPAQFILSSPPGTVDPIVSQVAMHAVAQTQKLAKDLLSTGMMAGVGEAQIDAVVAKLSSRDTYKSHGSVIDALEAQSLGLNVLALPQNDELWQRLWLLRCMYDFDLRRAGAAKTFEGQIVSNSLRAAPASGM